MAEPDSAEPPVPPNPVDAEPPVPPNPWTPSRRCRRTRGRRTASPPNHLDAEIVDPSSPVVPPNPITPDYTDAGVPTFTHVRDRIEERIGRAIGSEELAHETPAGRSVQEQWDTREKAAKERLEQIRKSLHNDSGSSE